MFLYKFKCILPLLENVQRQKDKFVLNAQEEIFETKQIEEHITKLKDTFEFVEKHGSDLFYELDGINERL
jgi:hypothetical protein